ncbi:MAG TPA: glycine oxidase ThiO [Gammaproteobacteria bacterium]|nr:glycine oxidase ThiO [Gammaproteobacteria bacterium]
MNKSPDVIVVGAGIIGLMTARELARSGLTVLLLERGQAGREASRAAGGILSPLYPWRCSGALTMLAQWSQSYYPVLADDLRRETGLDVELTPSGLLIFDPEEHVAAEAWARQHALPLDRIEPEALARCEPALAGVRRAALFLPTVAHIHNSKLLRALQESAMREGVPLRQYAEVTGFLTEGDRVTGVCTSEGRLTAGSVVVACGAWAGQLLATLGIRLAVRPVRGQIIQFDGPPGLLGRILLDGGHYLLARRNGSLLAGSTVEEAGFDKAVTEVARAELAAAAARLLPLLAGAPIRRQWAGLRPASHDELPYIGPHPAWRGLFVNTGHFRNGLTIAPASARLLADLLLGRRPIVDPACYDPARS